MRKTMTVIGAMLIATSAISVAAAAGQDRNRKAARTTTLQTQQLRNANAAAGPFESGQYLEISRGNAGAAPAGR